MNEY